MATRFNAVIRSSNWKERKRFRRLKRSTLGSCESPRTALSRAAWSKSEPLSDISSRKASRCLSVKHRTNRRSFQEIRSFQKELLRFQQRQSPWTPRCRPQQVPQFDAWRENPESLSTRSKEPGAVDASLPKISSVQLHNGRGVLGRQSPALVLVAPLLNWGLTGHSSKAPAREGEFGSRMCGPPAHRETPKRRIARVSVDNACR